MSIKLCYNFILMLIILTLTQLVGESHPTSVIEEEIGHGVVSAFRYAFILSLLYIWEYF